jgi:UDP-glucose:tetrahydrobiopterin glucosyltransferase
MKLLFVSSPVSSLNSGRLGGVALNIRMIAEEMLRRGHQLQLVAPSDSAVESLPVKEIAGAIQPLIPEPTYNDPVLIPDNAVLGNMWDYARQVQADYDLIVDFGYEWLPFYLSPFFSCPVLHYVCIGSWTAVMDRAIAKVAQLRPGTLALHTQAQAQTFPQPEVFRVLGGGIDLSKYQFCETSQPFLAWAGRISPEKGIEDAFAAAVATNLRLQIFGYIQDPDYWQTLLTTYPLAQIDYHGFLPTQEFQAALGQCRALLMTHKWIEALGRVALEALACGVPVISYRRGGPIEIIEDGISGYLVEPDSLPDLITAIQSVSNLDRYACRQRVEAMFSMQALGDRLEQWFEAVLRCYPRQ